MFRRYLVLVLFGSVAPAYCDPCLPNPGTVSSLIQKYEGTLKSVTQKLIRPSHAEFIKAINTIRCTTDEEEVYDYNGLLKEMREIFKEEPRNISPFKDDGGESTDELLSIFIYTHGCFNEINDITESGKEKEIQAYLDMVRIALNRLPPYRGTVVRGSNLGKMADFHQPGNIFRYRNFVSTSKDETFVDKKFQLLIHSETGRYVAPYSSVMDEEEVLFPPGTAFKVQDRLKPNSHTPIYRKLAKRSMRDNKWNPDPANRKIELIILKELDNPPENAPLLPPILAPVPTP